MMHTIITTALAGLMLSSAVHADVVVIGHPAGPDKLTKEQVQAIYLNRTKNLPDGSRAQPFEISSGSPVRDEFHSKVTGRNDSQLKAFWSQQVFTGKGQPPKEVASPSAVKSTVATTP